MNNSYTNTDLRKFGLILGVLFAGIFGFLVPSLGHKIIPTWPWIVALVLWLPAAIYPRALALVYKVWMKIGDVLGFINTRIILGLLFFFIIWPIGLLKRMLTTDVMGKRFDPNAKTYRTTVTPKDIKHMEKPF